jgi:sensor histidine kinase YesM
LVLRAKRVSNGELEIEKLDIKTNYELNSLIDSFNNMVERLKELISDIENKAIIESKLKEQEIKNLEISNLLNESELKFLQSQINPHFMFNTMNTIMALAKIEGAKQTADLLKSMTDILRYNLKKIDVTVTLYDEVEIIKNYIYIQKTRFGAKIDYILNIDESALAFKVPSMILQPFVENSIIHGLEPKEGKGYLEVSIMNVDENIYILIKDNGIGMSEERLKAVIDKETDISAESRSGIGVKNVIRRLELKYGSGVVSIKSVLHEGTEISIKLDKKLYK